jgi:hypothetical protein
MLRRSTSLTDQIVCPICLEEINSCQITSCGHVFCGACIRESLDRRHICPLCQTETCVEKLVPGFYVDNLILRLKSAQAQSRDDLIQGLAANVPGRQNSPIREVFQRHLARSLLAYEDYFEDVQQAYITRVALTQQKIAQLQSCANPEESKKEYDLELQLHK